MTVSKFSLPSIQIDNDLRVLARIAAAFTPHSSDPESLGIVVDAGHLVVAGTLIESPIQLVSGFVVPEMNSRIDRVVVDAEGTAAIVSGVEAPNPVPPTIPAGTIPVAQVRVAPGMTSIPNEAITDERDFSGLAQARGTIITVQRFTSSGTYLPTPGTTAVIVELVGGGGSGGSCAAPGTGKGASASGGSAGAFGRTRITSDFTGVEVTVGNGGTSPAAGAITGNPGGASSFGDLITAAGGRGGASGVAYAPPAVAGGPSSPAGPATANIISAAGGPGGHGLVMSTGGVVGGNGGDSYYGGGGNGGGNANGYDAISPGAAGGGASSIASAVARQGGAGAAGQVTIYEFS